MTRSSKIIWEAFSEKRAQNGSKSLMISGHLDEIGFIVTQIDKDGYIYFTPIGAGGTK